MAWTLDFEPDARRDLRGLAPDVAKRIVRFLNDRVLRLDDPRLLGEALRGPMFAGFWKYRVGDYRVIAVIENEVLRVVVVRIQHRRDVYRKPLPPAR